MNGAGFDLGPRRRPRRMSLTPMIDVVFLLLIFFMLASRFGMGAVLPIAGGAEGNGTTWEGAPRLVGISPDGVTLNGLGLPDADLAGAVLGLLPAPDAPVILRPGSDTDLQRLVDVIDLLRDDGINNLILVE